jgi:hypothetical protein
LRLSGEARLLLLNERFHSGAALLIARSLGLRAMDGLTAQPASDSAPWVRAQYSDGEGRTWKELDVAALLQSDAFLEASS